MTFLLWLQGFRSIGMRSRGFEALADSASGVSSIYSYSTCDKVWNDILKFFALGRLFSLNLQE